MAATKEISKLRDLLGHSEQIRQNQVALINMQNEKLKTMHGHLDALTFREMTDRN